MNASTPSTPSSTGDAGELFQAFSSGQTIRVRELLTRHPQWAQQANKDGLTPLMLAAERGDLSLVQWLLPSSPVEHMVRGRNAFLLALEGQHHECAQRLLAPTRDDPKHRKAWAQCWFHSIAQPKTLALLLPYIEDPNVQRSGDGRTALIIAAGIGQLEAVRLLLPLSNPNVQDHRGDSALLRALRSETLSYKGDARVLSPLIQASNVHLRNAQNDDALSLALHLYTHNTSHLGSLSSPRSIHTAHFALNCLDLLSPHFSLSRVQEVFTQVHPRDQLALPFVYSAVEQQRLIQEVPFTASGSPPARRKPL